MRKGLVIAAVAGLSFAVLGWPGSAAATAVAPAPNKVGGAFTAVSSCGSLSGVGISWTVTANVVTSVVLTGVPAACVGGALSLTLVDASNASLASAGPVTVTGTAQTLGSLTGPGTATSVVGAYVSVVGP